MKWDRQYVGRCYRIIAVKKEKQQVAWVKRKGGQLER